MSVEAVLFSRIFSADRNERIDVLGDDDFDWSLSGKILADARLTVDVIVDVFLCSCDWVQSDTDTVNWDALLVRIEELGSSCGFERFRELFSSFYVTHFVGGEAGYNFLFPSRFVLGFYVLMKDDVLFSEVGYFRTLEYVKFFCSVVCYPSLSDVEKVNVWVEGKQFFDDEMNYWDCIYGGSLLHPISWGFAPFCMLVDLFNADVSGLFVEYHTKFNSVRWRELLVFMLGGQVDLDISGLPLDWLNELFISFNKGQLA